jgi:hypothetical protein
VRDPLLACDDGAHRVLLERHGNGGAERLAIFVVKRVDVDLHSLSMTHHELEGIATRALCTMGLSLGQTASFRLGAS